MTDIPNTLPDSRETTILDAPDRAVKVRELFGIYAERPEEMKHRFAERAADARNAAVAAGVDAGLPQL